MPVIPLWGKLLFWMALAGGIAFAGWKVNGWRMDSARASQLETQLSAERTARLDSDKARLKLSLELAESETKVRTEIKETIKRVPVLIHDNRACDLSDETVSQLNRVRGYDK